MCATGTPALRCVSRPAARMPWAATTTTPAPLVLIAMPETARDVLGTNRGSKAAAEMHVWSDVPLVHLHLRHPFPHLLHLRPSRPRHTPPPCHGRIAPPLSLPGISMAEAALRHLMRSMLPACGRGQPHSLRAWAWIWTKMAALTLKTPRL